MTFLVGSNLSAEQEESLVTIIINTAIPDANADDEKRGSGLTGPNIINCIYLFIYYFMYDS